MKITWVDFKRHLLFKILLLIQKVFSATSTKLSYVRYIVLKTEKNTF